MSTSDQTEPLPLSVEDLRVLLAPTSTTPERLRGLLALGLTGAAVASAVGVSASALRNWTAGIAEPRADAAITLDDLRAAAKALLDGHVEPARVTSWLTSRTPRLRGNQRPLDLLATTPVEVLVAVHEHVLEGRLAASAT